jgi:hypothetical protein
MWLLFIAVPSFSSRSQPTPKPVCHRRKNGDFAGYKALEWDDKRQAWCSPSERTPWKNGTLAADRIPAMDNTNGIYLCKHRADAEEYLGPNGKIFWVGGVGPAVEHEYGFRVAGAYIIKEA